MGMFDYVQWNARLPVKHGARVRNRMNPAQSKSLRLWETEQWGERACNEGCVTVTVTPGGRMIGPDGEPLRWSGLLNFYGAKASDEFVAMFMDGELLRCDHDPA